MPELAISDKVWKDLVSLAEGKKLKPGRLAERVIKDYIRRCADEELIAETERAAQRAPFRIEDTEEIIRQYRRRKAMRANNGRSQKTGSRRT